MNRIFYILIAVLILVLAGLLIIRYTNIFQTEKPGALQVSSLPAAKVYLTDRQIGSTPFMDDKITPGEYTLKIVPEGNLKEKTWQGKIKITSETMTAITVQFLENGQTEAEILSLEPIEEDKPQLLIMTTPDEAKINLNGENKGNTPLIIKDLTKGDINIVASKTGYNSKTVSAKTENKYRLSVTLELSSKSIGEKKTTENKKSADIVPKITVKVKETPTGWLRVREEPSIDATEAAKINTGETFPFLVEEGDWTKIEYEKGKNGWVSSQYVDKIGAITGSPTPTKSESEPTPLLSPVLKTTPTGIAPSLTP